MSALPWHGSIAASGFVFDEELVGRPELVKRLLAVWTDRARLARAGTRWYLVGLSVRQVDSRVSPGAPLTCSEGRWLMGPVDEATLRATPMDSILECVAGRMQVTPFTSLTPVHPSELIELELPTVLEVELLPAPPQPAQARPPSAPATLDAVFGAMLQNLAPPQAIEVRRPPPPPGLRERLGAWFAERARLRAARPPRPSLGERLSGFFASSTSGRPSTELDVRSVREPPAGPSWLDRVTSWLGSGTAPRTAPPPGPGWMERLAGWLTPTREELAPRDPPAPEEPGWLGTLWRNLFSGDPTPDQQRDYLEDLRRRFAEGDLSEALRRAMPLGGAGMTLGLASIPARRDQLSLFSAGASGRPAGALPDGEYQALQKMYRESVDALVARGQIQEAAYVLAKLLNDGAAAVALLEKHGKLELAAQLATAQHLPEVDRIRLWLLAGRKDEAIRIARASTDFQALVGALSTRAPELARQLRSVWGDFLAERARFIEAVVVTAPLAELPPAWGAWVERSLEAGGAAAATALAVDLSRHPDHSPQARARVSALLEHDEQARLTVATAEAFLTHAPNAGGPLYRELWRRLMRGASEGHRVDRTLTQRLLKASGDPVLALDAVANAQQPGRAREPLLLPAPVVPGLPVFDVALLPKGRRVLAQGAAGLTVMSASGSPMRHLLVKADALVVGPVGVPVLVISVDGILTRVWKLDPQTLELTSWFQGRLAAFSRRYDGLCWAVGMESALVLLDPAAAGPMEWWRVPNTECRAIDASGTRVIALATDLGLKESWRYVFNAGTERLQVRYGPDMDCWARGDTALPWELKLRDDGLMGLKVGAAAAVSLPSTSPWNTFPMDAGLVLTRITEGDTEVRFAPWSEGRPIELARLSRAVVVRCRDFGPDRLALCDEHGRVTELDLS